MATFVIITLGIALIDTWQNHLSENEKQDFINQLKD